MAVFRVERTQGYTVMSNYHLRDKSLSLKAKGLLSQMLSLPEDWDYTLSGLAVINREKCILQLRGVRPFLSDKYDITRHPNFQYTADADDKNAFDIEAFLSTRLKPKPNEVYDVFEVDVDTEGE